MWYVTMGFLPSQETGFDMISALPLAVSPGFLGAGLLAVLAGLWTVRIARRSVAKLVAMLRTETEAVTDIGPGLVEVEGEVVSAGEAVEGKMTGEEAVVTEYRRSQDQPGHDDTDVPNIPIPQQLVPTGMNRGAVPFYVEDETGRVLVDAANASVSLSSDATQHSTARETRAVEARLEPGDEVYVIGEAVPVEEYSPDGDGGGGVLRLLLGLFLGEHRRVPASAVMDGDGEQELVITQRDRSEFLIADTAEWRGWIRQSLMVVLWTAVSLLFIAGGGYVFLDGLVGLPSLL